jgi:hypothetical protein
MDNDCRTRRGTHAADQYPRLVCGADKSRMPVASKEWSYAISGGTSTLRFR